MLLLLPTAPTKGDNGNEFNVECILTVIIPTLVIQISIYEWEQLKILVYCVVRF